jgi:hypothetical protein
MEKHGKNMEKPVDFPFNPPIEMADQLSLAISEL